MHALDPNPNGIGTLRGCPDPISPALERLVSRFGSLVRTVAHRYGLTGSEEDELFQDIRIRLWRALSTGERIANAPASYVYRTAVTAAVDLIRRRRPRRGRVREEISNRLDASLADRSVRPPDAALENSEIAERVTRAVSRLSESRRAVVKMYLVGYRRTEIAERLGWTEPKTRNLLYRGLADLRASLGGARSDLA